MLHLIRAWALVVRSVSVKKRQMDGFAREYRTSQVDKICWCECENYEGLELETDIMKYKEATSTAKFIRPKNQW